MPRQSTHWRNTKLELEPEPGPEPESRPKTDNTVDMCQPQCLSMQPIPLGPWQPPSTNYFDAEGAHGISRGICPAQQSGVHRQKPRFGPQNPWKWAWQV